MPSSSLVLPVGTVAVTFATPLASLPLLMSRGLHLSAAAIAQIVTAVTSVVLCKIISAMEVLHVGLAASSVAARRSQLQHHHQKWRHNLAMTIAFQRASNMATCVALLHFVAQVPMIVATMTSLVQKRKNSLMVVRRAGLERSSVAAARRQDNQDARHLDQVP